MNRWLDGEIKDSEKIRRNDRLVSVFNIANEDNEAQRVWELVKTTSDVHVMMYIPDDIV